MNSEKQMPTMAGWESAWANSNTTDLANCYTADGVVVPPNQKMIQTGSDIVNFFKGGMGQINVNFFPEKQILGNQVAYEFGIVRDSLPDSGKVVETCHYAITYALEAGEWKIEFHTWSIPIDQ